MLESQTWVKLLHAEGWTFVPITSQTSDIPAQELRKKRLGELFGEHVFTNYHILGTGADKDRALAEFHDTGLYWVEDKPKNAVAGLKYGLKPILIDHPYNRDFNHPEVIRVSNWKQIHQIVIRKKMKVYVGHDSREDIAYQVCEHSIKRRDPSAEVIPIKTKADARSRYIHTSRR